MSTVASCEVGGTTRRWGGGFVFRGGSWRVADYKVADYKNEEKLGGC